MTKQERFLYLIATLEHGNARAFANRTGIDETVVSRIRSGKREFTPSYMYKVIDAYPELNSKWVLEGEGEALTYNVRKEIEDLKGEVAELRKMLMSLLWKSAEKSTEDK